MNQKATIPPGKQQLPAMLEQLGLEANACYQCGRCSAGCPLADFMDLPPMRVVRLCAYGQEEKLLASRTIWLCASCETCTTRCPNGIDIAGVMDLLRQRALASGVKPAEPRITAFHKSFLRSLRRWGRTFEVGLLAAYKTRSGDLFGDLRLGLALLRRGKLRLLPRSIRGRREVRRMFEKKERQK